MAFNVKTVLWEGLWGAKVCKPLAWEKPVGAPTVLLGSNRQTNKRPKAIIRKICVRQKQCCKWRVGGTWMLMKHLFPCFHLVFPPRTFPGLHLAFTAVLVEPRPKRSSFRPPEIHMWPWSVKLEAGNTRRQRTFKCGAGTNVFVYCQANQTNRSRLSLPLPCLFLSMVRLHVLFQGRSAETAWVMWQMLQLDFSSWRRFHFLLQILQRFYERVLRESIWEALIVSWSFRG